MEVKLSKQQSDHAPNFPQKELIRRKQNRFSIL